jgi:hypothetical protein
MLSNSGMVRLIITEIRHALADGVNGQVMKQQPVNDAEAHRDQDSGAKIEFLFCVIERILF